MIRNGYSIVKLLSILVLFFLITPTRFLYSDDYPADDSVRAERVHRSPAVEGPPEVDEDISRLPKIENELTELPGDGQMDSLPNYDLKRAQEQRRITSEISGDPESEIPSDDSP